VHGEVASEFERLFGRRYGVIETYRLDDAEIVLVMAGSFTTKAKAAIERWRSQCRRVGLLRLRMVRPFPSREIATALAGRRAVGVIDQNLSPGLGGIFYHEVAGALAAQQVPPPILRSFIGGLGGKDISQAEFDHVLETLEAARASDGPHEAELLFTRAEWDQVRNRLALAGKTLPRSVP
jgi:pyruvate ferredoxin oxidoreductase alpha subunit